MALDARSRSHIYDRLVPLIGDENANVLMSQFPSVEADELVTKQVLRAELAEVRRDMATREDLATLESNLRGDLATLDSNLRGDMATLDSKLRDDLATRGDLATLESNLRGEMARFEGGLRAEMAERFRQQTILLGSGLAGATAFLGALTTLT